MPIELQTNVSLVPEPAAPSHLVNIRWVTAFFQGLKKAPVRLVSTTDQIGTYNSTALTFTYGAQGPTTIDGELVAQNDRVLFTGQTDQRQNLVYEVTHVGVAGTDETVLTVADDFNDDSKIQTGVSVTVTDGDDHADSTWRLITGGTIVLNTTALEWELYVPPKTTEVHSENFLGDGALTSWAIVHSLATTDVSVSLYNNANHSLVLADVEVTDANTVTIRFALAPPAGASYRAVVIG